MVFFEGCPVGWGGWTGGRPRALIPAKGVREGLAWRERLGSGGGARASVPGG